ncbi:MAG: hypothetical protein JW787_09415 [Sedimentisphaerales bacterium]|nr:hypothetical protein [Sedimentisphaerales bacterium]
MKRGNVRKVRIITICLFLLFLSSNAFALIGPPASQLDRGMWSISGGYTYTSQDMGTAKIKDTECWTKYNDLGVVYDEGSDADTYKLKIRNVNTNLYYGQLSYGLKDKWEVYGQLGFTDVKAETKSDSDSRWYGYNLDNEFALGLGTRYTFAEKGKIDWGAAVHLNWYSNSVDYEETNTYDWGGGLFETDYLKETTALDTLGIIIAVGPAIDMGSWTLYGGAICQISTADYSYKECGSWIDTDDYHGTWAEKKSGDYDMTSFGAYVGAQIGVYKNYDFAIELQGTTDGWGAGVGIEIPF